MPRTDRPPSWDTSAKDFFGTQVIAGWVCEQAPGGRSASHPDGTGFSCDRRNGLAATVTQFRALPPAVLAWLVYPVLLGTVPSDDLESAPERILANDPC
jgi:hypothetical protein